MSRRIICASLAFGTISAVGFLYNYITKQKKLLKDGDLTNSIIQIGQPTKPTDVEIVMTSESTIVEEITRPVSPSPTFVDDGVTNTDAEYIKRSESENTPAIPFHQDLLKSSIQIEQPTKPTDVKIVMPSESTIVEEITRPVSPSPTFVDIPDDMKSITSIPSKRPRMSISNKKMKNIDEKRKNHPVRLLNELSPCLNIITTLEDKDHPPQYKVECVIDGHSFCAYEPSKKAAKKKVAILILNYYFDEEDDL